MSSEYLRFDLDSSTGKTNIWAVVSRTSNQSLGMIKWYSPWRRYCFFPHGGTLLDYSCLRDIASFIDTEMDKR